MPLWRRSTELPISSPTITACFAYFCAEVKPQECINTQSHMMDLSDLRVKVKHNTEKSLQRVRREKKSICSCSLWNVTPNALRFLTFIVLSHTKLHISILSQINLPMWIQFQFLQPQPHSQHCMCQKTTITSHPLVRKTSLHWQMYVAFGADHSAYTVQ